MKNNPKIIPVLYRIIYVLLILLLVAVMWIAANEINVKNDMLGPFSTFLGALLGALITGLIAISINKNEQKRIQEKDNNESEKVKKILQQYSAIMLAEYRDIIECYKVIIKLKKPWWAEEIEQVGKDRYDFKHKPSPDEKKENAQELSRQKEVMKISAEHFIFEAEKFLEINIQHGNLELTDRYLKMSASLKRSIIPVMKDIKETGEVILNKEEIEEILDVLMSFKD